MKLIVCSVCGKLMEVPAYTVLTPNHPTGTHIVCPGSGLPWRGATINEDKKEKT